MDMRKRRRRALASDLTVSQWLHILETFSHRCAYCARSSLILHKDCVIPVARGGVYTLANVVPACPSCNYSKGSKNVVRWMKMRGFDIDLFETRLNRVLGWI